MFVLSLNHRAATGAPAPSSTGTTGAGGSGGVSFIFSFFSSHLSLRVLIDHFLTFSQTSSATKIAAGGFAGVVALGVAALF